MRIPESVISELVNKADIVQYVGKYVSLEKRGRNHFGCCPFHEENTPSFSVSEVKHIFHCFGCHEGGGIIQFIMKYHHLSFIDAVFLLADEVGYDLSTYKQAQHVKQQSPEEKIYYEAFNETQTLYSYLLTTTSGKEAQTYLATRHIDTETQKQFGIGYAPITSVLKTHFDSKNIPLTGAYNGSLIRDNETTTYDFFRNRITFPIKDAKGNILAYTARKLPTDKNEDSPKYLNSPETPFFKKGELLYNYDIAQSFVKTEKRIFIFEGITDVIAAYQNGVKNSVAVLGTALTDFHARMLSRLNANVVLCFDSDNAGINAAIKSGDILLKYQIHTTIMQLPDGLDPDNYFEQHSKADFQLLQNNALDFIIYKAAKLKDRFSLSQHNDQNKYLDALFQSVNLYHDASDQQYFLTQIAKTSNIDINRITQRFHEFSVKTGEITEQPLPPISNQQPEKNYAPKLQNSQIKIEEKMLKILLEKKEMTTLFADNKGYFPTTKFQDAYRHIREYRLRFPDVDQIDLNHFFELFPMHKEVQSTIISAIMLSIVDLKIEEDYHYFLKRYMEKLKLDNFKEQKTYNLQSEEITIEQIHHLIQLKKDLVK